ncbi:MAG TPA: glutathione S-transferase N-terminal domain-containing protein [Solirubrobacteraceae bacterium]|nr:glutathione S-transferase N-terminal domain-containing protein [Solirubrobacteraceae bacterium]
MSASSPQPYDVREDVILYVIQGSHACRAAMLMLEHKQLPYRLVTLPTGPHPMLLRARRFAGHREPIRSVRGRAHRSLALLDRMGTVPALRSGSERVQTNRAIARWLERVQPQPPLFPADAERRSAVEEAEKWGDEVFQMAARRITLAGGQHGLGALRDRANDGRLGALLAKGERARAVSNQVAARLVFKADGEEAERELLAELPGMLDEIDRLIGEGVLGGTELNAADFMIAPSLALIAYRLDLRPQIETRPARAWLERVLPEPPLSDG